MIPILLRCSLWPHLLLLFLMLCCVYFVAPSLYFSITCNCFLCNLVSLACDCYAPGTASGNDTICDRVTGQCMCNATINIGGRRCDRCMENSWNTSAGCQGKVSLRSMLYIYHYGTYLTVLTHRELM